MTNSKLPPLLFRVQRAGRKSWAAIACLLLLMLLFSQRGPVPALRAAPLSRPLAQSTSPNSLTSPDTTDDVGDQNALVLDRNGFPVVSYYDATNGDLKLLHCNDVNCAGNNESITAPDTVGDVGQYTSLALDNAGNPVISYRQFVAAGVGNLKVLHCNDPNCAGNNESITTPDAGDTGRNGTLRLDAAGNPVIVYIGLSNNMLRVMHCNDANCAGNNESISSIRSQSSLGGNSFVLDSGGRPVVSFHAITTLTVMHCNDANCAGGNETFTTPATLDPTTYGSSLVLDAAGHPVIGYMALDVDEVQQLRVLHCNDSNCAGGDDPINTVGGDERFLATQLALDDSGYPALISVVIDTPLRLLRCSDVNCASFVRTVPTSAEATAAAALALDGVGKPVISYWGLNGRDLRLLHCGTPTCTAPSTEPLLFLSSADGGTVGGVTFADEDILAFNLNSNTWSLYLDGSDVISRSNDIDAFKLLSDGSILMSFNLTRTMTGAGEVTPNDIVKFTPTSLGGQTQGSFAMYLDGSDVELEGTVEDIDAIVMTADGKLAISTRGAFSVFGLNGQDEDLIALDNAQFGENSTGSWRMLFDGSDVALNGTGEDVKGAWINPRADEIYLSAEAAYTVPALSGDANDVFLCRDAGLGTATICSYTLFWDGAAHGFAGQHIDGLEVGNSSQLALVRGAAEENDEDGLGGGENQDPEPEDRPSDEEESHRVYLPRMTR